MTFEEIEKIIREFLEYKNGMIKFRKSDYLKVLNLESLIYLCKKCYFSGVDYGKGNLSN